MTTQEFITLLNAGIKDFVTLPDDLIKFDGDLDLSRSSIQSLGNLEYVGQSLYLQNTPIQSLGNLKEVGWSLNLRNSQITSLGKLEKVGWLDLVDTPIQSLGDLEYVGQSLYLQNSQITSLGNLKEVGRSLLLYNTPLAKNHTISELEKMYPQFEGKFIII